eukprot:13114794-Ditylum_brightwellii.AAC.1
MAFFGMALQKLFTEVEIFKDMGDVLQQFDLFVCCVDFCSCRIVDSDCLTFIIPVVGIIRPNEQHPFWCCRKLDKLELVVSQGGFGGNFVDMESTAERWLVLA